MDRNVDIGKELKQVGLTLSETEYMQPGHMGCAGCGAIHAMRYALKVLGKKTVVVVSASCWSGRPAREHDTGRRFLCH